MPDKQFEPTNHFVRKWSCFVCGKQHETYEEYKLHITDEHEEGREYVSCPACEAPVRDLKSHFLAKHPNRVIPKDCQMTVTVWHDFSGDGKKKKTRKPKARQGFHESTKMREELHYRSGYEKEVYELLDEDAEVLSYYVEPFKIPYYHGKDWHEYIPDLRVNYVDGKTDIWEIKPASQTTYQKNKAKWAAAQEHATKLGWNFMVITEVGIDKLRMRIKNQRAQGGSG